MQKVCSAWWYHVTTWYRWASADRPLALVLTKPSGAVVGCVGSWWPWRAFLSPFFPEDSRACQFYDPLCTPRMKICLTPFEKWFEKHSEMYASQSEQTILCLPNEDFGRGTKDEICASWFGLRTIQKSTKNQHFIFCSSFQNLLLGSIYLVYLFDAPFNVS